MTILLILIILVSLILLAIITYERISEALYFKRMEKLTTFEFILQTLGFYKEEL